MTSIVNFSDIADLLDLEQTEDKYPALLVLMDSVHSALENHCGRILNLETTVTEKGFLTDSNFIDLRTIPVSTINSITVDIIDVTYKISATGVDLTEHESGKYIVDVTGGFEEIPPDVYRAELMQIVYEYQNVNNLATRSFSNDGGSSTTNEGFNILKECQRLLNPYVHIKKLGF